MDLKKVRMLTSNVQIMSGGFMLPQPAVFDAAGNMWVSDSVANRVWVITPAQLAVSSNNLAFTTTIKSGVQRCAGNRAKRRQSVRGERQ
jgi:hypothetical protein